LRPARALLPPWRFLPLPRPQAPAGRAIRRTGTTAPSGVERGPALRVLTAREYEILKSACGRLVPGASEAYGLDLALKIDDIFSHLPSHYGGEFKLLLKVFEYGTPLLGFALKRFTRMTPEEQDRFLTGWERSRLAFKRMGFQALKRTTLSAFYGSEKTWASLGYGGPWLDRGYPYDYPGKGIQHPARD